MKTWTAMLAAVLVAGAARGQTPPPPAEAADVTGEAWQKRSVMMLTLTLSEALGLDDAATLKLRGQLARFEERRAPLRRALIEQTQLLQRAAKGDTTAFAQVDGAIQKVLSLKTQLDQSDRDLFAELSAGLPPQKKAQLALVMARAHQRLREMAHAKGGR